MIVIINRKCKRANEKLEQKRKIVTMPQRRERKKPMTLIDKVFQQWGELDEPHVH